MIYEIKSPESVQANYRSLQSKDGSLFYWNNTKFSKLDPTDTVFVVNKLRREVLVGQVDGDRISTDYRESDNSTRFLDRGEEFRIPGEWNDFVRIKLIDRVTVSDVWNWTTLGSGEHTYVGGPFVSPNSAANNRERVRTLLKAFPESPEVERIINSCLEDLKSPPGVEQTPPSATVSGAVAPIKSPDSVLSGIITFISNRGFQFSDRSIKLFYSALRSKPFVICAGNSGTGKSRLIRLFAEASGATVANGQFTMIPVRPDWNDSSELIGYFDLNGNYVPGQVVGPMLLAHQNPSKPYFVCLDEMNLAKVEHYFSDFLSIVESRSKVGSFIETDPILRENHLQKMISVGLRKDVAAALEALKSNQKPLGLPENLYVVGTVNMDETTQPFSRKVLDRANTIEFNEINLLQGIYSEFSLLELPPLNLDQSFFRPEFTMLNDVLPKHSAIAKEIAEMISGINRDLGLAGFEVGYRIRDEAISFAVYAGIAGLSREEINEAIVLQKILPRVQGSSPRVERLLINLLRRLKGESDVPDENDPELAHKLAALRVDGEASAIVRKIAGMLILFREENFTSFWLA